MVWGCHIYKDIFTATIGKALQSRRELHNNYDSFAVAIIESNIIVLAVTIPPEDIALDKLPVGNGKGVLISCLKYFHRAISSPDVQRKNLEWLYRKF